MTPFQVARARAHRITSTRIAIIDRGGYAEWNRLADAMRHPEPVITGRFTGIPATDWGHRYEPHACAHFWWRHPEYDMEDEPFRYWHDPRDRVHWEHCGTSPDRTLYRGGRLVAGIEAKCPYVPRNHRYNWATGELPDEHRPQVYWHMIVTDTPYWYFVSYDPRDQSDTGYYELRVERDPAYEAELMSKVDRFLGGYLAGERFSPPQYDYRSIFNERNANDLH